MTGSNGKNIEHPIKELTLGKAAIAGLLRQITEEVREAESEVQKNTGMALVQVIDQCKGYLEGIAQGLVADQSSAKQLLNMCKKVLGEEADELDIV